MNNVILQGAKGFAFLLGYIGAFSSVRRLSHTFDWHSNLVFGNWFNFGWMPSLFMLILAMGLFAFCVYYTKPRTQVIWRNMDYALLVLLCAAAFYACAYTLYFYRFQPFHLTIMPVVAYSAAILAFGELIARLRDKTLKPTLYWAGFFKNYKIWQPIGFFALILLVGQLYLLIANFTTIVRIFSLITISAMTYFAAYLLNLAKQYEKANEEKIRAERFKTELITNVSHDIKTPLTSIINYVDLLKGLGLQGQAAEYTAVLDKKSARLKTLIDDLMEASKAGTGNLRVEISEINLNEIVGQVAAEFEDAFIERDLNLVIRQPENPVKINTDSRHLYRILENLLSNAAKYSLPGTRVFIEINDNIRGGLTVQNTAEKPLELHGQDITEEFIRGDISRADVSGQGGSGLGLYIAKSLAELVGHKLHVSVLGDLFRVDILF
jgi:signal transduction histidine kinase